MGQAGGERALLLGFVQGECGRGRAHAGLRANRYHHGAATADDHVTPLQDDTARIDAVQGSLGNRQRFPGQGRLVHFQTFSAEQARVGSYPVSRRK